MYPCEMQGHCLLLNSHLKSLVLSSCTSNSVFSSGCIGAANITPHFSQMYKSTTSFHVLNHKIESGNPVFYVHPQEKGSKIAGSFLAAGYVMHTQ